MGTLLDIALRASRRSDRALGSAPARTASCPSASAAPTATPPAASVPPERVVAPAAGSPAPAAPSGSGDLDRIIRLAELRRLVLDLATAEPQHWTPRDIAEALAYGEADLDAAMTTWRALCARLGVRQPEASGAEARRERVLAMLAERPGIRYAIAGGETDPRYPGCVVLGVGVRQPDGSIHTCDAIMPSDRYDPFGLLDLVERVGAARA